MAEKGDQKSGLRTLDLFVLVIVGIFGIVVAFWALHFIAGIIWEIVKVAILAAVVFGVLYFLVGRRRRSHSD